MPQLEHIEAIGKRLWEAADTGPGEERHHHPFRSVGDMTKMMTVRTGPPFRDEDERGFRGRMWVSGVW